MPNLKRLVAQQPLSTSIAICTAILLSSCGEETSKSTNAAPVASNVHILYGADQQNISNISDTLWTEVELTGAFTYTDAEQDAADAAKHQYLWLVDGETVSTEIRYTPSRQDNGKPIQFEVTPVAQTGTVNGNSQASSVVTLATKEKLFFTATPQDDDQAMYVTEGSADTTIRLATFNVGIDSAGQEFITRPVAFGEKWLFTARNENRVMALGITDGTTEGTYLLEDGIFSDLRPAYLVAFNNAIYFRGYDANFGYELWRTDGTANGTYRVTDINEADSSYVDSLAVFKGELYFGAREVMHGHELYKINTDNEVTLVKGVYPGSASSAPSQLTTFQDNLYFTARTLLGIELWRSDGTDAGTELVANINASGNSNPYNFVEVGNELYFIAVSDPDFYIREVWKTRGTTESTVRVSRQNDGVDSLAAFNDKVAYSVDGGMRIAYSAPTDEDPFASQVLNYTNIINSGTFIAFQDKLLFSAKYNDAEFELRMINADDLDTIQTVKNLNTGASSMPQLFVELNGKIVFSAIDDGYGQEVWTTDGTTEGTLMLMDLMSGPDSSRPNLQLPVDQGER
jgi:ELWxxDGT repeat protein